MIHKNSMMQLLRIQDQVSIFLTAYRSGIDLVLVDTQFLQGHLCGFYYASSTICIYFNLVTYLIATIPIAIISSEATNGEIPACVCEKLEYLLLVSGDNDTIVYS